MLSATGRCDFEFVKFKVEKFWTELSKRFQVPPGTCAINDIIPLTFLTILATMASR